MVIMFVVRESGIDIFVETPFETIFRGRYDSWGDVIGDISMSFNLRYGLWRVQYIAGFSEHSSLDI